MLDVGSARLPLHGDERGNLVVIEAIKDVPFEIKRAYYLFGTKTDVLRGMHAHHSLRQAAVAVNGRCTIDFDDGKSTCSVELDSPINLVLIEPMIWHQMRDFSEDCVLLVLADAHYDEQDYIRSRTEFLKLANER